MIHQKIEIKKEIKRKNISILQSLQSTAQSVKLKTKESNIIDTSCKMSEDIKTSELTPIFHSSDVHQDQDGLFETENMKGLSHNDLFIENSGNLFYFKRKIFVSMIRTINYYNYYFFR